MAYSLCNIHLDHDTPHCGCVAVGSLGAHWCFGWAGLGVGWDCGYLGWEVYLVCCCLGLVVDKVDGIGSWLAL